MDLLFVIDNFKTGAVDHAVQRVDLKKNRRAYQGDSGSRHGTALYLRTTRCILFKTEADLSKLGPVDPSTGGRYGQKSDHECYQGSKNGP